MIVVTNSIITYKCEVDNLNVSWMQLGVYMKANNGAISSFSAN